MSGYFSLSSDFNFLIFKIYLFILGGFMQVTKEKLLDAIQGHVLGDAVLIAIF